VLARLAAHFLYKYLRERKIPTGGYSGKARIRTVAFHLQMPASRKFSQPLLPAFVCQGEAQPKSMPQNLLLLFGFLLSPVFRPLSRAAEMPRKPEKVSKYACVYGYWCASFFGRS